VCGKGYYIYRLQESAEDEKKQIGDKDNKIAKLERDGSQDSPGTVLEKRFSLRIVFPRTVPEGKQVLNIPGESCITKEL
jgi:hypothetical protein